MAEGGFLESASCYFILRQPMRPDCERHTTHERSVCLRVHAVLHGSDWVFSMETLVQDALWIGLKYSAAKIASLGSIFKEIPESGPACLAQSVRVTEERERHTMQCLPPKKSISGDV